MAVGTVIARRVYSHAQASASSTLAPRMSAHAYAAHTRSRSPVGSTTGAGVEVGHLDAAAAGDRQQPAGAEREGHGRDRLGQLLGGRIGAVGAGERDRVRDAEEQPLDVRQPGRSTAGERAGVVVAAGQVGARAVGHEVQLRDVAGHGGAGSGRRCRRRERGRRDPR